MTFSSFWKFSPVVAFNTSTKFFTSIYLLCFNSQSSFLNICLFTAPTSATVEGARVTTHPRLPRDTTSSGERAGRVSKTLGPLAEVLNCVQRPRRRPWCGRGPGAPQAQREVRGEVREWGDAPTPDVLHREGGGDFVRNVNEGFPASDSEQPLDRPLGRCSCSGSGQTGPLLRLPRSPSRRRGVRAHRGAPDPTADDRRSRCQR